MVLTSDVSLIARAAKKSLENPNIHSRIRGAVKEILNCIEYCPLYPKSETKNDFDILISLKRSVKTPEEKELIEKAWRIVRRAEVNAQIRELEESMEPEEVDLEEEEEEKGEIAEEKQDSESLSKPTDLHQELTAVRKDFEEYKATNDAKLEALEQKVAQMTLGSGVQVPESSDIDSEAGSSSGSTTEPKNSIKVRVERLGPLFLGADQALGLTAEPKAPSGRPTQAQEPLSNKPNVPAPQTQDLMSQQLQQLQRIQQLQSKNLQNPHPTLSNFASNAGQSSGPAEAFSGSATQPKAPSDSTARPDSPTLHQRAQQVQYQALQNPQMIPQMMLNGFCMPYFYGPVAFSGLTTEPQVLSGSTARSTEAQKVLGLANGPKGFSGLTTEPKGTSGSTPEPKETSGNTARPEMFPALLKQAPKDLNNTPKVPTPQTQDLLSQQMQQIQQLQQNQYNVLQNAHLMNYFYGYDMSNFGSEAWGSSSLADEPKAFSGLTAEPKAPSGSTARHTQEVRKLVTSQAQQLAESDHDDYDDW